MTTNEPLQKVSTRKPGRRARVDLGQQECGIYGQDIRNGGLTMIWPPEDGARCISVRWLVSRSRIIPVARNEHEP
jgi:hypothetical protein